MQLRSAAMPAASSTRGQDDLLAVAFAEDHQAGEVQLREGLDRFAARTCSASCRLGRQLDRRDDAAAVWVKSQVADRLGVHAPHDGRGVGRDDRLRVRARREMAQRFQNPAQVMRREAVLGFLERDEGEAGRPELRRVDRRDAAGDHLRAERVQGQDKRQIEQRLLPVAEPGPVDRAAAGRGIEGDVQVPEERFDIGSGERHRGGGEVRPGVQPAQLAASCPFSEVMAALPASASPSCPVRSSATDCSALQSTARRSLPRSVLPT